MNFNKLYRNRKFDSIIFENICDKYLIFVFSKFF